MTNFKIIWLQGPTAFDESKFIIIFPERDNKLFNEIEIQLFMPDMGHGALPVTVKKLDEGIYKISDVYFNMTGLWEIQITTNPNQANMDQFLWNVDV